MALLDGQTEPEKQKPPSIAASLTSHDSNDRNGNTMADDQKNSPAPSRPSEQEYPPQKVVVFTMIAVFMTGFLVALDRTIIGTAIPKITDEFHSLGDVGWYASAYLLTMCSFQLFIGRIYTFYNPKWVYITNICIFEVGSIICAVAQNSTTFIVGRAVAGLGSAGIFSGAIVLMVYTIPLHKRPMYTGIIGSVFGVASVVGPLLGGAFTDSLSWRWCFWINLPFGGVSMTVMILILKLPIQKKEKQSLRQQLAKLDPIGTALFLPSMVCLLLALQWGGTIYAWNSGRIIALLVLFGVLLAAFIGVQIWKQETATLPPRIIRYRSVLVGTWLAFCNGSSMMIFVYYLPIWFQAIKGVDAERSGIMVIPFVLALVVASILAGFSTRKIGYYTQWVYLSAIVMPVGAGLLTTFSINTGHSKWIGYQVVYGFGLGVGMQQPSISLQVNLARKDVPTGAALIFFAQSLGGSIFTSVGSNVFTNELVKGIVGVANLNPVAIVRIGATELKNFVSPKQLPLVLKAYNHAIVCCFYVGLAMACGVSLGAVWMEWKSTKQGAPHPDNQGGQPTKEGEQGVAEKV